MTKTDTLDKGTVGILQGPGILPWSGFPGLMVERAFRSAKAHLAGFDRALKLGIKIACGAETCPAADCTLLEIEKLVKGA